MSKNAFDSSAYPTPENAVLTKLQNGLHQHLSREDLSRTAQAAAAGGFALEQRGVLPDFKIAGIDPHTLVSSSGKESMRLLQGVIKNDPDAVAQAAAHMPDATYNLGGAIHTADQLGVLHAQNKQEQELLDGIQTIHKKGNHFQIALKHPLTEHLGGQDISVEKNVKFDLAQGDSPGVKNIDGVHTKGGWFGLGSVDLQDVTAHKTDHGRYDYDVHHGGVFMGIGSGDVTLKT